MKLINLYTSLLLSCALSACQNPTPSYKLPTPKINLPAPEGQWHNWQCQNQDQIQTLQQGQTLQLKINGQNHHLQQSTLNPIIYQNQEIAFYYDGKNALIGAPYSDLIYYYNCQHR